MASESKRRELTLNTDDPNKPKGEVFAEKVFQNGVNSSVLIAEYLGGMYGDAAGLSDWAIALRDTTKAVHGGDLKSVEAILTGQALALDAIFTNMARKAILNNRMDQLELCMRLALKAQNQSRATLEALAAIKNPQKTVFMKQANISNGPQQVNNNFTQQPQPQASNGEENPPTSPKNFKTEQNELLNAHEEIVRLDTGTASPTSRDDQKVEAVGKVNRSKNRVRQSNRSKER